MKPINKLPDIHYYEILQSTNNELRKNIGSLDNLSVIATMSQTAGRGQGDHTWYSSYGTNILCSFLYCIDIPASEAITITQITTLGIVDYLNSKGVRAHIKWPNDIWVADKKICGILIENIIESSIISKSIVGIGLNLNETSWPSELPNPISLKELTSVSYDIKTEINILQQYIAARYYKRDNNSEDFYSILKNYL